MSVALSRPQGAKNIFCRFNFFFLVKCYSMQNELWKNIHFSRNYQFFSENGRGPAMSLRGAKNVFFHFENISWVKYNSMQKEFEKNIYF